LFFCEDVSEGFSDSAGRTGDDCIRWTVSLAENLDLGRSTKKLEKIVYVHSWNEDTVNESEIGERVIKERDGADAREGEQKSCHID